MAIFGNSADHSATWPVRRHYFCSNFLESANSVGLTSFSTMELHNLRKRCEESVREMEWSVQQLAENTGVLQECAKEIVDMRVSCSEMELQLSSLYDPEGEAARIKKIKEDAEQKPEEFGEAGNSSTSADKSATKGDISK